MCVNISVIPQVDDLVIGKLLLNIRHHGLLTIKPWAAVKKLPANVTVPPDRVGFPANDLLPRVLRQSRLSANDNSDQGPDAHGAMGCGQKSFKLAWRYHKLVSGHLPRVSRQSRRSLIIRVIMK